MNATSLFLYFSKIGHKGGSQRKKHPLRIELASQAAKASWSPSARAKRVSNKLAKRKRIYRPPENKD